MPFYNIIKTISHESKVSYQKKISTLILDNFNQNTNKYLFDNKINIDFIEYYKKDNRPEIANFGFGEIKLRGVLLFMGDNNLVRRIHSDNMTDLKHGEYILRCQFHYYENIIRIKNNIVKINNESVEEDDCIKYEFESIDELKQILGMLDTCDAPYDCNSHIEVEVFRNLKSARNI